MIINKDKFNEYYNKKYGNNIIEMEGEEEINLGLKIKRIEDEIMDFMKKIKEVCINENKWEMDNEKKEIIYKYDIKTTFNNPLNTITDLNRNYSNFKIVLNMSKT